MARLAPIGFNQFADADANRVVGGLLQKPGFGLSMRIEGIDEVVAALQGLDPKLSRSIVRKAIEVSTKPTLMAAKANARRIKDSGLLAKTIRRKTVTYNRDVANKWAIVAVIGPARGMGQIVKRRGFGGEAVSRYADPVKYAHLVEYGTASHALQKGQRAPRNRESVARSIAATTRAFQSIRKSIDKYKALFHLAKNDTERAKISATLKSRFERQKLIGKRLNERMAQTVRTEQFKPTSKTGRGIHPGTKPRPFLRPAFDSTQAKAKELFAATVRSELEKLAAGGGTKAQRRALGEDV